MFRDASNYKGFMSQTKKVLKNMAAKAQQSPLISYENIDFCVCEKEAAEHYLFVQRQNYLHLWSGRVTSSAPRMRVSGSHRHQLRNSRPL